MSDGTRFLTNGRREMSTWLVIFAMALLAGIILAFVGEWLLVAAAALVGTFAFLGTLGAVRLRIEYDDEEIRMRTWKGIRVMPWTEIKDVHATRLSAATAYMITGEKGAQIAVVAREGDPAAAEFRQRLGPYGLDDYD